MHRPSLATGISGIPKMLLQFLTAAASGKRGPLPIERKKQKGPKGIALGAFR
jgi:hypothetical protein